MTPVDSAKDIAFVIVSCDRYSDLWEPFFYFFEKYWPDCPYKVYLISNHKAVDRDWVTTIKVGDDRSYSDNLRQAIDMLDQEWVILWLEDVFFRAPVDTARFTRIIDEARSIPVGYLKLSPQLPLSYEPKGAIGPLPKGIRYRSGIGVSLYRVETLKKLLIPGASAWDLDTSTLSNDLDEPFYALTSREARKPLMDWEHGVIKGQWCWPAIALLKRHGFEHVLAGRQKLDARSVIYAKLFLAHNWLFRTFKKHWI